MEPLKQFQPHVTKAQASVVETRDTGSPALITHLLMPLIESIGSPLDVKIIRIRKRVRDDTNLMKAELPWRRSPFWLVLRVSIHRHLQLFLGSTTGRACYKFLVVILLTQFLEKCTGQLAPELVMSLRTKICRRLAKLEQDKESDSALYSNLFKNTENFLQDAIRNTSKLVECAWDTFKRETTRKIPKLAAQADPNSFRLSLPNSGTYLRKILKLPYMSKKAQPILGAPLVQDGTIKQVEQFTDFYFRLAKIESDIENQKMPRLTLNNMEHVCIQQAQAITKLFTDVGTGYDSNPEQMSVFILNIFTFWVQLDKIMTKICPLLLQYHPVFTPGLLNVLHCSTIPEIQRLRGIQQYLQDRHEACKYKETIFSEPNKRSFAVQYVAHSSELQKLANIIKNASEASRRAKKTELTKWQKEYEKYSAEISKATCICSLNQNGNRFVKGCVKCYHWQRRNQMQIKAHEDFLPENPVIAAAVVFELGIPKTFAAYRNATWRIFGLAHPSKPVPMTPTILLKNYEPLQEYENDTFSSITLASKSKPFRNTHYKVSKRKMKATEADVLFPNGLHYFYFDTNSNVCVEAFGTSLTFEHFCGIHVPPALQELVIPRTEHPPTEMQGPSSYEIVASESVCPKSVSSYEFTAMQRLLSGRSRRWLTMLVELGASNINFSSPSIMRMFNDLAIQVGPAQHEGGILGDVHAVFNDETFCERLAEQIEKRLRAITTNWREVHCMEVLITLTLRLFVLASSKSQARNLLLEARNTTLNWIKRLRADVRSTTESSMAETAARYAFWAALLCRRTYSIFTHPGEKISDIDLTAFTQSTLALQENLLTDLDNLSPILRGMLIRDTKMAYKIQPLLVQAIHDNPQSIGMAINKSRSCSEDSSGYTFSTWQMLSSPYDRWIVSTMTSATSEWSTNYQVVHYNFIEGHLLFDGKPLGRLPHDIRESNEVKRLFGNQHLLTYPSAEPGMSYVLATKIQKQEIFFGMRDGRTIIRTRRGGCLWEYIPPETFMGNDIIDLPLGLINDCMHWLNLNTKCVEVRRKPKVWYTRPSDWIINVVHRNGSRNGRTSLVDPNCALSKRIAGIFQGFENPQKITIYQPMTERGRINVELRHLDLSFFVNRNGLLQCRELGEEIDDNQDAGTLYGLQSKIVLRDIKDRKRRSIIIPWGNISAERRGMHVAIWAASTTEYARFGIDEVLGRLSCAVEPRLVYAKAQFHAYTSFVIPDPLTKRTGTEEALHILQAGYCQPWQPLGLGALSILDSIEKLSPERNYYPTNEKVLQNVFWNENLTTTIQHEEYEGLVRQINDKSDEGRRILTSKNEEYTETSKYNPTILRKRGVTQRRLYERNAITVAEPTKDKIYKSRGQQPNLFEAAKVYHIAKLLQNRPFQVDITRDLSTTLQESQLIGGFQTAYKMASINLSDIAEMNAIEEWGSLVNACRSARDLYPVMFRLCLMTLNPQTEFNIIKILAAFTCLPGLKELEPPIVSSFSEFQPNELPSTESLFRIISVDLPQMPNGTVSQEQRDHIRECEQEGMKLAKELLNQWRSDRFRYDKSKYNVINVFQAVDRVIPEFRRLRENMELSKYLTQVQSEIDRCKGPTPIPQLTLWSLDEASSHEPNRNSVIPSTVRTFLLKPLTSPLNISLHDDFIPKSGYMGLHDNEATAKTPSKEMLELRNILSIFSSSPDALRKKYGSDLKFSLDALEVISNDMKELDATLDGKTITKKIDHFQGLMENFLAKLRSALFANDNRWKWLELGHLWPCNTSIEILEQLRSSTNNTFGRYVKEAMVSYGVLVTKLQQLVRIRHAIEHEKYTRLQEELADRGHENWNPIDFPDWLLLEIDGNILIRQEQVDVAHAIISPTSKENTVLQLNMGKGKTSCIVPMAMAVLSNGRRLTRLLVPKPLLLPTAQILQTRLGGLVGRELRHIPFSRNTKSIPEMIALYAKMHRDICHSRGVVLNAPEHVLSFKLSGLQHLVDSKLGVARQMIKFQTWLNENCRDVLDESDISLSVKTQLIYPSGGQTTVDGHPHRWQVSQSLLSLVKDYLPRLQSMFPRGIEVIKRGQGYPMIYILQSDVEEKLHRQIIDAICTGRTTFLRFADSTSPDHYSQISKILCDSVLDNKLLEHVASLFVDKNMALKVLLLVRGLILNRILLLCLKKRWNVQFGLHPARDPIAVPFEGKGVPHEQAEFGHPDAAILLTCLAFYYTGLTRNQFDQGLRHVLSSHDPSGEYDRWTSSCHTLPEALGHWNVINIDDQNQVEALWKHLRDCKSVLDHYMNHFVFPMHAKQFSTKLQASGWDLPSFPRIVSRKSTAADVGTTGFSGTNDNKMMLPLTIKQNDLPSLRQTSAEVLTYLLQDRNREYFLAAERGKRLCEEDFLKKLTEKNIRILIDAGACILEMGNMDLARKWLTIDTQARGAVFFGSDNRAWVLFRGLKTEVPLLATAFADNLEDCLIYFDEAHTRGIDLKLPQTACGALTLAIGQTKDHTVQGRHMIQNIRYKLTFFLAAMRLRQLATTQSVAFFAFPETHQSILDVCKLNEKDKINSSHVVHWLLEQTCRATEQLQGLYISQGADFCNRIAAEWENPALRSKLRDREIYIKALKHPEQQFLEELYGNPKDDSWQSFVGTTKFPRIQKIWDELGSLRHGSAKSNKALQSSALEEVEQEREVEFQMEEVRQVQPPMHYTALTFPGIHPAISAFVITGVLRGGSGYESMFAAISHTSIGHKFGIAACKSHMFVSAEFMKTIETRNRRPIDNFIVSLSKPL